MSTISLVTTRHFATKVWKSAIVCCVKTGNISQYHHYLIGDNEDIKLQYLLVLQNTNFPSFHYRKPYRSSSIRKLSASVPVFQCLRSNKGPFFSWPSAPLSNCQLQLRLATPTHTVTVGTNKSHMAFG